MSLSSDSKENWKGNLDSPWYWVICTDWMICGVNDNYVRNVIEKSFKYDFSLHKYIILCY